MDLGLTTLSESAANSQSHIKIGKDATVVLREPSLGPVFGIKGGAAGGVETGVGRVMVSASVLRHQLARSRAEAAELQLQLAKANEPKLRRWPPPPLP